MSRRKLRETKRSYQKARWMESVAHGVNNPKFFFTSLRENNLVLNIYAFGFLEPVRLCFICYILVHIWNFNLIYLMFYIGNSVQSI